MTLVHAAYWGLIPEVKTVCTDVPHSADDPYHKWVMGDEDQHVWCFWCKAIAWRPPREGVCAHGRVTTREVPLCPLCPCLRGQDHEWGADTVAKQVGLQFCVRCHAMCSNRMMHRVMDGARPPQDDEPRQQSTFSACKHGRDLNGPNCHLCPCESDSRGQLMHEWVCEVAPDGPDPIHPPHLRIEAVVWCKACHAVRSS